MTAWLQTELQLTKPLPQATTELVNSRMVGKPEVESTSGLPVIWESAGTFFDKPTCRF
jgi:hypothetical protein